MHQIQIEQSQFVSRSFHLVQESCNFGASKGKVAHRKVLNLSKKVHLSENYFRNSSGGWKQNKELRRVSVDVGQKRNMP